MMEQLFLFSGLGRGEGVDWGTLAVAALAASAAANAAAGPLLCALLG